MIKELEFVLSLILLKTILTIILTKLSSLVSVGEETSNTMRSGSYSPSGILSGSTGRGRVAENVKKL